MLVLRRPIMDPRLPPPPQWQAHGFCTWQRSPRTKSHSFEKHRTRVSCWMNRDINQECNLLSQILSDCVMQKRVDRVRKAPKASWCKSTFKINTNWWENSWKKVSRKQAAPHHPPFSRCRFDCSGVRTAATKPAVKSKLRLGCLWSMEVGKRVKVWQHTYQQITNKRENKICKQATLLVTLVIKTEFNMIRRWCRHFLSISGSRYVAKYTLQHLNSRNYADCVDLAQVRIAITAFWRQSEQANGVISN